MEWLVTIVWGIKWNFEGIFKRQASEEPILAQLYKMLYK